MKRISNQEDKLDVEVSLHCLTSYKKSNNLTCIHTESRRYENIYFNKFQTKVPSATICKDKALEIDPLKIKFTSNKKLKNEKQEDEVKKKGIIASLIDVQNLSKFNENETQRISLNDNYYTCLYVDLDTTSSGCKIYSSSQQHFYKLRHQDEISLSFVSTYHTYVLKLKRTNVEKNITHKNNNNVDQRQLFQSNFATRGVLLHHDQEIKSLKTFTTSIFKQLSFVSRITLDVNKVRHPITSSEVNALIRCRMSSITQSKPPKCKKSPQKTTKLDVGYLQNLILQSDLVLCNPLEDDSDTESDHGLHDKYLSDFCYFDILDLDILYQIFNRLPTRDLAALKCVCQDFKWFIEFYDIGGVDSKWSECNSYRDDPCMHCGKIKDPSGDVSLCRWHPKGYYKDGHYGRQYWICCRQNDKDAAGCMVGVHDNNWTTSRERLCHIPKPKRKASWNTYLPVIQ